MSIRGLIILCVLCGKLFSQPVTLDYIFQDPPIINPRPSLKFMHPNSNRAYYYADDDFNYGLSLFYYDLNSGTTYKFPDTMNTPSEFQIMPDGDLLMIMGGDLFISKNFFGSNVFTADIRLTSTNEYEYSPIIKDDFVIYRRAGNYFLRQLDSSKTFELQLTRDESDTVSYQILDLIVPPSRKGGRGVYVIQLLFTRYDNSRKETFLIPNFTGEKVTIDRWRSGISEVMILNHKISSSGDSLKLIVDTVKFTDTSRYSVQYGMYAEGGKKIIFDTETLDRQTRKIILHTLSPSEAHGGEKAADEVIYSESDPGWFERHSNPTLMMNDSVIIFESEVSGYNSVYRINTGGSGLTKIAGGDYTILESVYDTHNGKIYYTANEGNPAEWRLYETDFDGSYVRTLSDSPGGYEDLSISMNSRVLAFSYSAITNPKELYIIDLSLSSPRQITNTISPKFSGINWKIPELVQFNNEEDGAKVYAYLYKPDNFSARKKYPLICFAHGGGYWQNVTAGFGPYQDNFMVNTFLTAQGFMVIDVDFRGSMGYGKEFRNKTHKNLGYWEVSDYISGINHLDRLGMIDREKVGIYGGSYGGFISLMAAFRHPEHFKAAVALRPVSDWKSYTNWWFTLARLGNYEDNKLAYEISSPITYAADLKVPLLISHGMRDDNVFLQQSVHLIQKLIDEKKDFEMMFYPKEYHSFRFQSSWLDQYKRIYDFFKRNLLVNFR